MLTFSSIDKQRQFLLNSKPCCDSSSSISTSTSKKSVDLQQQHQQLECVACSRPCPKFPPNISCDYVTCVSFFFDFRHPRDFTVPTSRRPTLYYRMERYGMVWYGMVWYGTVWYGMVWYGMVWYGMVGYGMVWYGMVSYGMAWHGMVW